MKIKFKNNTSNVSNSTKFEWDFGDGTTATTYSSAASATYTKTYTNSVCNGKVTLTATNICGSSNTSWNPIHVSGKDKAKFSVDRGDCQVIGKYTFLNESEDSFCLLPDVKKYKWDFGDGNSSKWINRKENITHTYAPSARGERKVCLYAQNACGTDSICQNVNIVLPPKAAFIIDTLWGCGTQTVSIIDTSEGDLLTRLWTFSNGGTSSDSITSKVFNQAGNYTVSLKVNNICGSSTTSANINVYKLPKAKFSGQINGCVTHSFALSNTSTTDFSSSAKYQWSLGNGTTSTNTTPPNPVYADSGSYNLRLILEDLCGIDTSEKIIRVELIPTLNIVADTVVCLRDSVSFTSTSNDLLYLDVDYRDGHTEKIYGNGTFKHKYTTHGYYSVIIKAVGPLNCSVADTFEVHVKDNSVSDFSVDKLVACSGDSFHITNNSKLADTYFWYTNNLPYSTDQTPPAYIIDNDSTLVDIKLVTADTNNCKNDTFQIRIATSTDPIAQLTPLNDTGCGPIIFSFANTSISSSSYQWNFDNRTTSTDTNPTATFHPSTIQDTIYRIRLIAANWLGCTDTIFANRYVYPQPLIHFTPDISAGCGPLSVNYTNNSSPRDTGSMAILQFNWDFGNGSYSSATTPSTTYLASSLQDSIYTVKLEVTTEHNCVDSVTQNITVYPQPSVAFSTDTLDACGPAKIAFNNMSAPNDTGTISIMQFAWNYGNGIRSAAQDSQIYYVANPDKDTTYTIKLIGTSEHGCIDSTERHIRIYPKPTAIFNKLFTGSCSPLDVQFNNTSFPKDTGSIAIMNFHWDFGNGTTSTTQDTAIQYTNLGQNDTIYYIKFIGSSEHQCKDTLLDSIRVSPTPNAHFTVNTSEGCGPLDIATNSNINIADTFYWNFGNGYFLGDKDTNVTYNFIPLRDTTHQISLTVRTKNNCGNDTFRVPITVWAQPIAAFNTNADSLCFYDSIVFDNISQAAASFHWDLGNGIFKTDSSFNYHYPQKSDPSAFHSYDVMLESFSTKTCKDSVTKNITILPYPEVKINYTGGIVCSPAAITFSQTSTNADSILWNYGTLPAIDNTGFQIFKNRTNKIDEFPVSITVRNNEGCVAKDSINIQIAPQPTANFSFHRLNMCDSGYFDLLNTSRYANTSTWNINNSITSTQYSPNLLLGRNTTSTITHTAQLIVDNTFGCSDTIVKSEKITPWIIADFNTARMPTTCTSTPFSIVNNSKNAKYYFWYFGDGGVATTQHPTYFYKESGLYTIDLVAYDSLGCSDTISGTDILDIMDKPAASFDHSPISPKLPNSMAYFTNQSTSPTPFTNLWQFGELGATSALNNPSHTYSDSGWYNVTLIINNTVCKDTAVRPLYVEPPLPTPKFSATNTEGCGPLVVSFTNTSTHATRYKWLFGDGYQSTEFEPTHTYTHPGFYDVNLIAFGPGGDTLAQSIQLIEVYPRPKAFFYVNPLLVYLPDAFFIPKNESFEADQSRWEVYDENNQLISTSTDSTPQLNLAKPGRYTVKLVITGKGGCQDSMIRFNYVEVFDGGLIHVPNAFTPFNNDELNVKFKPTLVGVQDENYSFEIYTRWGEKVFSTTSTTEAWDGTYKGEKVQQENFVYYVKGRFISGQQFNETGVVTVIR